MNGPSFKLRVLTPAKVFERDVSYLRLKDETGYFGIMKGHTNFITAIVPSLGYYTNSNGREVYIAANGGILS
ncbi:MAG: F0F1 ATP synthase subunit epsilon, partial [Nitrospiraceae bacterium]|nr:F0F1 ATP synthase subunit epsilon [Nitrospiraceae bacterium]